MKKHLFYLCSIYTRLLFIATAVLFESNHYKFIFYFARLIRISFQMAYFSYYCSKAILSLSVYVSILFERVEFVTVHFFFTIGIVSAMNSRAVSNN